MHWIGIPNNLIWNLTFECVFTSIEHVRLKIAAEGDLCRAGACKPMLRPQLVRQKSYLLSWKGVEPTKTGRGAALLQEVFLDCHRHL